MNKARLLKEFEKEKINWGCLPRKDSFSGLGTADRLNRIQQTMHRRGYDFKPLYMEINIEIG